MSEGEIAGAMKNFGISRVEAATVQHLGDGVYASFDGYQVWLRSFNGITVLDQIALEPTVVAELYSYCGLFMAEFKR